LSLRVHKYDLPAFQNIMPAGERRHRKAFFFIERLMQTHPDFRETMRGIQHGLALRSYDENTANRLTHRAIMEVIAREKAGQ